MIVDDELDLVRVLKRYLEKKGFQVDTYIPIRNEQLLDQIVSML
jgi:DNA-binding response OmpR family regulator